MPSVHQSGPKFCKCPLRPVSESSASMQLCCLLKSEQPWWPPAALPSYCPPCILHQRDLSKYTSQPGLTAFPALLHAPLHGTQHKCHLFREVFSDPQGWAGLPSHLSLGLYLSPHHHNSDHTRHQILQVWGMDYFTWSLE